MPYLKLKLSAAESVETTEKIAVVLTELTADILKKKRELTAVEIEFISPQRWFIGGVSLQEQNATSFYLDIKVTEGTNTKDEKARYVGQVFSSIESIIGPLATASYVVIEEVNADAWGYQGQTQEFRYIKGKAL